MNSHLTPAMHKFLSAIRDSPDEYAVQDGLMVYVDLTRFHAGTVNKCLRLCLVSEDQYSDEATRIWILNEDGRGVLESDSYVPGIVRAMSERVAQEPKE
jgi:hypothetical protein